MQNKNYLINRVTFATGLFLTLLFLFSYSLGFAFYNYILLLGVVFMALPFIPNLVRAEKNFFLFLIMLLMLLLILFRNNTLYGGTLRSSLATMSGIILFFMLKNSSYWQKSFIKWVIIFSVISYTIGIFFLLFPNLLISHFVPLMNLDLKYTRKLMTMISNGYMTGIANHYSLMGMYMALGSIAVFSQYFVLNDNGRISFRSKGWFPSALMMLGCFLTGKRAHFLFTLGALFVMYVVLTTRIKMKTVLKFFGATIFSVLVVYIIIRMGAFGNILSRYFRESADLNSLSSNRLDRLWVPALYFFRQHPIFGIGWKNFSLNARSLEMYFDAYEGLDAHNVYIQLLAETGVIGFGVFMSFFIYNMTAIIKTAKVGGYLQRIAAVSFGGNRAVPVAPIAFSLGYQVFFLVYCLTGNPLYDSACVLPYFFACSMGIFWHSRTKSAATRGIVSLGL